MTTRVSRYQKGKTNLDFTETRDSEWQWHQMDHMLQTDNHASTPPLSFLQTGCASCRPTNSVKALKAKRNTIQQWKIANKQKIIKKQTESMRQWRAAIPEPGSRDSPAGRLWIPSASKHAASIDWVVVQHPTQHKICHCRDVSPSQALSLVWKKLNFWVLSLSRV